MKPIAWNARGVEQKNGQLAVSLHLKHINFMDEQEKWQPIDLSFKEDSSAIKIENAPFSLYLPKTARGEMRFEDTRRFDPAVKRALKAPKIGKSKMFTDAQDVSAEIMEDGVLYRNAFPDLNADLLVQPHEQEARYLVVFRSMPTGKGDIEIPFIEPLDSGFDFSLADGRNLNLKVQRNKDVGGGFAMNKEGGRSIVQKQAMIWDSGRPNMKKRMPISVVGRIVGNNFVGKKVIPRSYFDDAVFPVFTDTTDTIYPHSCDGHIGFGTGAGYTDWSAIRSAASANYSSGGNVFCAYGFSVGGGSKYVLFRDYFNFDTSILGAGAVVSAGDFKLTPDFYSGAGNGQSYVLTTHTGGTTSLAGGDYSALTLNSPTELCSRKLHTAFSSAGSQQTMALNSNGLAAINGAGYTRLLWRGAHDIDNNATTGTTYAYIDLRASEYSGTTSDPQLYLVYTVSSGFRDSGILRGVARGIMRP